MAAPLVFVLSVAGPLEGVRPADVDGDGVSELVLASPTGSGEAAGLRLEVVDLGPQGETDRQSWTLPGRAAWWDAGHGLWKADANGLVDLMTDQRVLSRATPLPARGGAHPGQATMVQDLDGDGSAELFFWARDEVLITSTSGTIYGTVPAPPRTELSVSSEGGGQVLRTTLVTPPIAVADMNGDAISDILVLGDKTLSVHQAGGGTVVAVPTRLPLPRALTQPDTIDNQGKGAQTTTVLWADMNGDGRADLVVHRLVASGKLTGNVAEVHVYPNTGSALGAPQVVQTGASSAECFLVDFDGDGDLDVLLPQVRIDVGSLAQAVFDRSMTVELALLDNDGGRLGSARELGDLAYPLEGTAVAWSLFEDLDGDGLPDLALALSGTLKLFKGDGRRLAPKPWAEVDLGVKATNLWAVDLTGDGAAELVAWAPEDRKMTVVRLR